MTTAVYLALAASFAASWTIAGDDHADHTLRALACMTGLLALLLAVAVAVIG